MELIRTTRSICPVCYCIIDAELYEENGAVYMEKSCAEHGTFKDLCWSDYQLYRLFEAKEIEGAGRRGIKENNGECPFACGLCPQHESSTVLGVIDVTMRCNLRCPTCFAIFLALCHFYTVGIYFHMLKLFFLAYEISSGRSFLSVGSPPLNRSPAAFVFDAKLSIIAFSSSISASFKFSHAFKRMLSPFS